VIIKLFASVALALAGAHAHALGSLSDLKNVCDFSATAKEARLINATAFLAPSGLVHYNASTNTYNVDTVAFTQFPPPDPSILCMDSLFYGETSVIAGRTGVLIAPNIILTAPHAAGSAFNPQQFVVVFRDSLATGGTSGCTNFTWTNIPASDVYFPNSSTALVNTLGSSTRYDYAAFQLDRNVTGRQPVKIRRSGAPRMGDISISAGYPERTSEKVDTAVVFAGIATVGGPDVSVGFPGNYLYGDLNAFEGNSGSPVYSIEDEVVEAVVSYGSDAAFSLDSGGTCYRATNEGNVSDTNGIITDIASAIPRNEVLVTPMDYVVHVSDIGAPTDHPVSSYQVSPVTSAGGGLILLDSIVGPTGSATTTPAVSLSKSSGIYTLPAAGLSFDFDASTSSITQCGAWDYQVNVLDVAHDENNYIRHRFEVGLVEISATPEDDWIDDDIGSPYSNTRTYVIKNVRPTPTSVEVYAGGDLPPNVVTINGGGMTTVNLGPAGSPTDTATFVIGISANADAVATPGTVYNLFVAFANTNFACAAQDVPLRYIRFKRGERQLNSPGGPALLAAPAAGQTFGASTRFDVDASAIGNFCVSDLNLDLGFPSPGTGPTFEAPQVQVTLTSPAGRTGILWDRNTDPGGAYNVNETVDSVPGPFLHLDDQTSVPLGPTHLNYFNGQRISGHWYIDIRGTGGLDVVGPVLLDFTSGACFGTGS